MRALVLAAGLGTRLWPLTADRTKPAVPFLGRPLVVHALAALARLGVTEAAVNLHYRPESVRAALRDLPAGFPAVRFSSEPTLLGTAGAMDPLRDFLGGGGPFVVMNGKVVCDLDLRPALEAHRAAGALATLVLVENARRDPFREVLVHPDGRLAGFGGMPEPLPDGSPEPAGARAPLAFTGIQFLEPAILDYVPRGVASDTVRDVYARALADGKVLLGVVARGLWADPSTPRRYLEAHLAALEREAGGPADRFVAPGAAVAPGARVARAVLWSGARVEAGAEVEDAVLGEGAVVPRGTRLAGAAAVRAVLAAEAPDPLAGPGRPPRGLRAGDLLVVPFDDAGGGRDARVPARRPRTGAGVSLPASFADPPEVRARAHAASLGPGAVVEPLAGDASDRCYFRVRLQGPGGSSWVLAVHAEPFDPAALNTLDATRLFRAAGLPVPAVLEVDAARGVLRLEDLGDRRLQTALAGAGPAERLAWYREAVGLIHGIQRATPLARAGGYQAGRLAFDVEKLGFETAFFFTHFVEGLLGRPLPPSLATAFRLELDGLVAWLAGRPRVLVHRDYHARNLMVRDRQGGARLAILDHQDARMGPATYDLASLVYDPYVELAPDEVGACLEAFVEGAADPPAARAALAEELDRMAVQRLLKAAGSYGYHTTRRRTEVYLPYIAPALDRALAAARRAGGLAATVEAVALLLERSSAASWRAPSGPQRP